MLIAEFALKAGLSKDTVRFYVRRGLIVPATGGKGGRNPYQIFSDEDVRTARMIRMAQSLGMSLKEIAAINRENRAGRITRARSIELLRDQLARLDAKAREIGAMTAYLRAKLAWYERGGKSPEPDFQAYLARIGRKRA